MVKDMEQDVEPPNGKDFQGLVVVMKLDVGLGVKIIMKWLKTLSNQRENGAILQKNIIRKNIREGAARINNAKYFINVFHNVTLIVILNHKEIEYLGR